MNAKPVLLKWLTAILLLLSFKLAMAALPPTLNYQGHLTNSSGVPVNGPVTMTFNIYNVDAGGLPLWSYSRSVTVSQGVFSVELGDGPDLLPPGLFETPLWIGLSVAADAEMTPRRPITTTAFAFKAGDANTIEGISASTLDQSAHVTDTSNPHNVTATQIGAITSSDLTWNNLNNIPADIADGDDVGITAESDPTVIASVKDGVSWSEVTSKPAGFADDIDNDSGGDITAVTAGSGLSGGGTSGGVTLSHADTSTQSSVNNSNGTVIQDITLDGNGHLTGLGSTDLDTRYFTEGESDGRFVNAGGDTMTGTLSLTGYNEILNINGSGPASWLRWMESGVTRGAIGYSNVNTFWPGPVETDNAFMIKAETALHLGDDKLVMTIDNNNVGIGTTNPVNKLDVRGDVADYLVYVFNNTTASNAFGLYSAAFAYNNTGSSTAYGGSFAATGGNSGGSAYGVFSSAYAYGSSNSYGVYSNATGGPTTGNEYAFYGVGKGYISQDLDVNGTTYLGYEQVSGTPVSLALTATSCGMISTGTCYFGSATASCPTGKVVIGGGCSCNSSYNCGLIANYPVYSSTWQCKAVASSNTYSLTAYANCARVDD